MTEKSHEIATREPLPPATVPQPADATNPHGTTRAEMERRLMMLHESKVHGMARHELLAMAQVQWDVSRRTAQWYLQKVERRLERPEGRLQVQNTGQIQRNRLFERVLTCAEKMNPNDAPSVRALASLIEAGSKLIDDRERTAKDIDETLRRDDPSRTTIRVTTHQSVTRAVVLPAVEEEKLCTAPPALPAGEGSEGDCHKSLPE